MTKFLKRILLIKSTFSLDKLLELLSLTLLVKSETGKFHFYDNLK
jgi:hypothetical protein